VERKKRWGDILSLKVEEKRRKDRKPPSPSPPPLKLRTGMPSPLWVEGKGERRKDGKTPSPHSSPPEERKKKWGGILFPMGREGKWGDKKERGGGFTRLLSSYFLSRGINPTLLHFSAHGVHTPDTQYISAATGAGVTNSYSPYAPPPVDVAHILMVSTMIPSYVLRGSCGHMPRWLSS